MGMHRRNFLGLGSAAFAGLALSGCAAGPFESARTARGYGPLVADARGIFDLPRGFSYRVISSLGDTMDDGHRVPDLADGMGAFALGGSRVALVRNHELKAHQAKDGPFARPAPASVPAFDRGADGQPLPGGTTTIVYDCASGRVERQHLSLSGTIRNCAGGTTPWGSWLTCEEDVTRAGTNGIAQDHGWVFEVRANARGPVAPHPLRAMGRFNHEAACVDPRTGIVYMTEDREDGLF
jgi:secreted PhoX family phosphatase